MHNRICNALDTNKNFWKEMKNLGLMPTVNDALHGFLPEELNSFFSSISLSPTEDPVTSFNSILSASSEGFVFQEVSVNDVILAVSHFSSQAKGEDDIPQSVIAKALPSIANHLTKLFNTSLKQGIFPEAWKRSHILALKKVSVRSSTSDFRPIALLCFLSKVLEKLAHDQVVGFLTKSNILDKFQTGFRKHHSTQTALIKLTDDIRIGKDKKLATLLVQFDFSKAFDNVSPSRLLKKLQDIGFSKTALQWFWSYLCGRSMCVHSKSSTSAPREINIGVPQGSVLGPLLFCIYMNDLQLYLNDNHTIRILYADDLQIYIQVPADQIQHGLQLLSDSANKVSEWAETNLLSLNIKKTSAIVFGTSHMIGLFKKLNVSSVVINKNGDSVPFVDEVLILGVILDSTLSWKQQVHHVSKKVNRALFGLRFIKSCTSQLLRRRLFESLIIPHLDYCTVVYADATFSLRAQLQRLANSGIRYIFGIRRSERITPFRKKLKWLSNDSRRDYFAMLIMYRIIRMKEPPLLLSFFKPYLSDKPQRGPRKDLAIPIVSTDSGLLSYQVKYANLWNSIPSCIRYLPSFSQLKKSIKVYFSNLD